MWNRHRQTAEFPQPWLLRFFDQIQFYEVDEAELAQIREDFPLGHFPIDIEETEFSLVDYQAFLQKHSASIAQFKQTQQSAFDAELDSWKMTGQFHFEEQLPEPDPEPEVVPKVSRRLTVRLLAASGNGPLTRATWSVQARFC